MASIAPCFLGNCKVRSFDLYLKKLPCNTVYTLLLNSVKHPRSTRDLGPCVLLSLSLSLSLFLADSGARRPAAFLLSLSYCRLWTTKFWSIKGSQQVALRIYQGPSIRGTSDGVTQDLLRSGSIGVGKYKDVDQTAGKSPHFSTLLHHLLKVQGLLVSCQ